MKVKICFLLLSFCLLCACKNETSINGQVEGKFEYINAPHSGIIVSITQSNVVLPNQNLFAVTDPRASYPYLQVLSLIKAFERDNQQKKLCSLSLYGDSTLAYRELITVNDLKLLRLFAKAKLHITHVTAKHKIEIFNILYHPGMYVEGGATVLSVLPVGKVFVVFYVDKAIQQQLELNELVHLKVNNKLVPAKINYIGFSPSQASQLSSSLSSDTQVSGLYQVQAKPLALSSSLVPGNTISVVIDL